MSFAKQSVPSSKRKALAEIRVLAESRGEILILSPQGFLLIFRDRTPEMLARQLRDFDTAEWRDQVEMDQLAKIDAIAKKRKQSFSAVLEDACGSFT